jgi:hypothetical protein
MLPSVGIASVKDSSGSVIDDGASVIDSAAHRNCRLAHQNKRPNFFSTEMYHRNVEDAPNAYRIAVCNTYCCVWLQCAVQGRNGRRKKHAARVPTAPTTAAHRILCQVKKAAGTLCCIRLL